jgi:HK97 family phage major capsid protein
VTSVQEIEQEFGSKFSELTDRAGDINERISALEGKEGDDVGERQKALAAELTEVGEAVKALTAERDEKFRQAEFESMKEEVSTLSEALKAVREDDRFSQGDPAPSRSDGPYGRDSEFNFYADAAKALKGDTEALGRWQEAVGEKAMTESTGTTGGFLVPDQISSELLELKIAQTVLRPRFSTIQVSSDTLRIAAQTQGLVAGWVAELAEKPLSDLAFGEISTNVFTKAGLAVVSNQLLKDADRSVQSLVNRDLAKRLARLEELAFIAGSGTGQPKGIINTPGVGTAGGALTSTDVNDLLDKVVQAITAVYTDYLGAPDTILCHPRTWARIITARNTNDDSEFLVGPPAGAARRQATDPLPGYGQGQLPVGSLFGLPVLTSVNVPIDLGGTNNQSVVIVGRFDEGLILDREGVTLDSSEHVYFTSNQTVFRAEDRVGFTAARYPQAFQVIGGSGLANG